MTVAQVVAVAEAAQVVFAGRLMPLTAAWAAQLFQEVQSALVMTRETPDALVRLQVALLPLRQCPRLTVAQYVALRPVISH